jgi:hypothetical protein
MRKRASWDSWAPGVAAVLAAVSLAVQAAAQVPVGPQRRPAAGLAAVPQLASSGSAAASTELTIRWTSGLETAAAGGAGAPPVRQAQLSPVQTLSLVASRSVNAPVVRERDPQLSWDQLVVVAVDAAGTELGWLLVKDPRIIRAEEPTATGVLTGQILYRPSTEFPVSLPGGLPVAAIRIYQATWTGDGFVLESLGSVSVPAQ